MKNFKQIKKGFLNNKYIRYKYPNLTLKSKTYFVKIDTTKHQEISVIKKEKKNAKKFVYYKKIKKSMQFQNKKTSQEVHE
jgi:hypothetical protein